MPLYEFQCQDCAHDFERIMSFTMGEPPACPGCGSDQTRRKLSMPSIHFRGSGFYQTDSRAEQKKQDGEQSAKEGGEKEKDGSAAKDDANGQTKSETKADKKAASSGDTTKQSKTKKTAQS